MANVRLFPGPLNKSPIVAFGTSYGPFVQGTAINPPAEHAQVLEANGLVRSATVGTTAQRPTSPTAYPTTYYIDTTLNAVIIWDGTVWRNMITGASV